ncbi:MAG: 3-oxoacid CoA-transferase subunit B [Promethearchaeota archaeon]
MIEDVKEAKTIIAKRIAKIFKNGNLINLGIGVPTWVPQYVPKDVHITLQSENGITGMGPAPAEDKVDKEITNAGGTPVTLLINAALFDTALSFGMIRGGHLDYTVLGAFQVDQEGNLANWAIPGKLTVGMGGAMDLVSGAKNVIIATTHTNKKNESKILKKCTLPLTGAHIVTYIVTELGFFECTKDGLVLREIQKNATLEEIRERTEADYTVDPDLKIMDDA